MCRTKCQGPQNGHGQKTDRDTDRNGQGHGQGHRHGHEYERGHGKGTRKRIGTRTQTGIIFSQSHTKNLRSMYRRNISKKITEKIT
jgi:hypothetical protein